MIEKGQALRFVRDHKIGLWICAAGSLIVFLLANEGFRKVVTQSREIMRLKVELSSRQKEHKVLAKELWMLENDMSYVERLARKELGMIQQGEIEYRFVAEPDSQAK